MKPKLLLVTEKWCDGNPKAGLSNTLHNVHGSIEESKLIDFHRLFYDIEHFEGYEFTDCHIDDAIINECNYNKPDFVIILPMYGKSFNPTIKSLEYLKKCDIKVVYIWPDVVVPGIREQINFYEPFVDLNIVWDSNKLEVNNPDKVLFTWTPQDGRIYRNYFFERDKFISFAGSLRQSLRREIIELIKTKYPIYVDGGQRERGLSIEDYAQIFKTSKISLNVSLIGNQHQLKGRVFEATMCGSLLLETKNDLTPNFFEPYQDYMPFNDQEDLFDKLDNLANDEPKLNTMALFGYIRATKDYNSIKYWSMILERLKLNEN